MAKPNRRWRILNKRWWILGAAAICIKILSLFPAAVEKYYSLGVYPVIGRCLRFLFGWLPFSAGDIFYVAVSLGILYKLIRFFKAIASKRVGRDYFLSVLRQLALFCLWVYILFNGLWGLNYNRRGIADQLQLRVHPYSTAELETILRLVVDRLNASDSLARRERGVLTDHRYLFTGAKEAYRDLAMTEPAFSCYPPSIKSSLFSILGNYLGFGGYYNPFSGEAQVNTTMPVFTLPFTTCHEMGHQLGYAKENEANFAGYLSAKSSASPVFRYSVYFELYSYAGRELYERDSNRLKPFRERLRPGIRQDFNELRLFYRKYQNPLEPYIRRLYGNYLKANQQPQGIMTYNEVVAWLVAWYERYGAGSV
ncbi:MAG: DUF3810 domain-containing protein [Puia sp.]|nr:DUF3810 domain-containing protein [Puia sp.]